ncbi:hypothetical protein BC749_105327 [Flavobacterium araucananum]|uniref:Arm DNA-binding domain-containing protein n=1 Tax=Flavobacterium araucananum TaxID=946678 RepID=A0A227P4L7_9FLAO|nr:hypothetical protein [Flavobacterium araucananum]OXG03975.1 hypothetical protein B0A64_16650 [Flavobacterium araucananum]PWJ98487.1 hypothetical protein BC749_105327 [Flavobacterium araucananum]
MLENSFGLVFFMKITSNDRKISTVYFRITVDGITKEAFTKRKWEYLRRHQKTERAVGSKEDAKSLNFFLGTLWIMPE